MSDLGHATIARRLYLHVLDGGQVTARDMARLVEKIEELEQKLADDPADAIWVEFKDKWEGEKKFALRQIVKFLKGGKDE
jgi:hypothetical protein